MINEMNSVPLYVQLYHEILEHIVNGEWPQDYKVPSEAQICEEYNVSRMTVRLAMDKLKDQGYLKRKQGQGTFVTIPVLEQKLNGFYSFSDTSDEKGQPMISKVISMEVTKAKDLIADKLQVTNGTKVFRIERVRSMDGIPVVYETSYIPEHICPQLRADHIERDGLYQSLMFLNHIAPDSAMETLEAVATDELAAKYLNTKPGQPAMFIQRIAKEKDTTIEYCQSTVRGDKMKYNIMLKKY
ncbi:MAG TPA: GntR family transcriptional regulator [Lachnospiraceae bacterium]|nr:GntR family transcriptional regulator [Lachnospiraceae bacterium]